MLTRLSLDGFRNLEAFSWRSRGRFELFEGHNGAGKTSFIEAVYVLGTTRSFRTPRLSECVGRVHSGFRIEGEVEEQRRTRLEFQFSQGSAHRKVNGSSSTLSEHLAVLPVINWTTAASQIFTGPPAERRRLLDQGIVASRPQSLRDLATYRQALGQKRKILAGAPGDLRLWNAVLAPAAYAVLCARQTFVEELIEALASLVEREALPYAELKVGYRPSPANGLSGPEAVTEALEEAAERELALRQPTIGPHRDELIFTWQERSLKRMVSAGERKGMALALTAARGEVLAARGRSALFLLDDVDAELDQSHLRTALRAFSKAGQVLATSSRPEVWEGVEDISRTRVEKGRMTPV